ncbi:hypothetical protein [Neomoorella mulderi]|jgi:hypothetical protein|uniref:Uncharacterized protein n=1 Tax=Moorella mulderi DSM 14980 TaxID=1122241 RepID=A0A151AWN9_9FIRM|nr:hypothetical protein [Moorella mulderi]KYH32031.1 hypothetical protein MOMUL_19130 [Moorella mulderi DSM 14980]
MMYDKPTAIERLLNAVIAGSFSLGGGFFLVDFKAFKTLPLSERQLAALALAVVLSLVLAGAPAGWLARGFAWRTMLPFGLACAGAYLTPALAWFAGLEPAWPFCWPAAFALAFAGSWAGLGLGLLLGRRRRAQ